MEEVDTQRGWAELHKFLAEQHHSMPQLMTLTLTCQPFLLILGLFFSGELVESTGCSIRVQWRELFRLQLLLDAVVLTAARRHCKEATGNFPEEKQESVSASSSGTARSLLYSASPSGTVRGPLYLLNSPLHCHVIRRWQLAPGLLKSQAAHVASSTIAEG